MERALHPVYRKVAIENSYYVEDMSDGTKKIIYQPIIYISSNNVKNLTIIELDKPVDAITDNASSAFSKDNNSLPNFLAPIEQTVMNAESAAAIAKTLPEIIKSIEQEEVIKSAMDALRNPNLQAKTVNAKAVNPNQNTSGPDNEILVINLVGLSNHENLQMQRQTSSENQDLSEHNKETSVADSDVLSNDVSLQTELETSNDDTSNSNKENSAANFDTAQSNNLEPQKDLSMTKISRVSNDSIQLYCNKCQVLLSNVTNHNCSTCQSLLVFRCINCTQSFESYGMVENHVKFECQIVPVFKCSKCNYQSNNKNNFRKHVKRHSNHSNTSEFRKSLECRWCRHVYPNKTILLKHQRYCRKLTTSKKQCPHCPYKSSTPKSIQFHIFVKHQEFISEKYKCSVCGVKYRQQASLIRHTTKAHKDNDQGCLYQCDYCGVKLRNKRSLPRHMRSLHASLF